MHDLVINTINELIALMEAGTFSVKGTGGADRLSATVRNAKKVVEAVKADARAVNEREAALQFDAALKESADG